MAEMEVRRVAERSWIVEAPGEAQQVSSWLMHQPGVREAWPAFGQVGVEADTDVGLIIREYKPTQSARVPTLWNLPVCYDFPEDSDLAEVARLLNTSTKQVQEWHTAGRYRVDAIGFAPGFPYMTGLPASLAGLPRLKSPRPRVQAGSVAVTESFCGVYPAALPGGWNILGRTPLVIAEVADHFFPLSVGDFVALTAISRDEFERRQGERLAG